MFSCGHLLKADSSIISLYLYTSVHKMQIFLVHCLAENSQTVMATY